MRSAKGCRETAGCFATGATTDSVARRVQSFVAGSTTTPPDQPPSRRHQGGRASTTLTASVAARRPSSARRLSTMGASGRMRADTSEAARRTRPTSEPFAHESPENSSVKSANAIPALP